MLSNLKEKLIKFQLSYAYTITFALLCAVSGLFDKHIYIPIICLLSSSVLFSAVFVKDLKVLIPPAFMIYYALGTDVSDAYGASGGDLTASFDPDAFAAICIIAVILFTVLSIRLILDGTLKSAFANRGLSFWGIIAIDISLLSNGLFSPHWSISCLVHGAALAFLLTLFYLVLHSVIIASDKSTADYACFALICASYIILIQSSIAAATALADGNLFVYYGDYQHWIVNRGVFSRSWGLPTIVGAVSVLGIPAALRLAKDKKHPIFYCISSILFLFTSCLINTRSAMLVGIICLIVGLIMICCTGRNKRTVLIFTASLLSLSVISALILCFCLRLWDDVHGIILMLLRAETISERFTMLIPGFNDFLSNPIFGVGLDKGLVHDSTKYNNIFSNMYHNIFVQFTASMGVVGTAAFLFHIKDIFTIIFKKTTVDRLLLISVPLMIILMSLFDNFFFYLNFQIFYVAFLSLAEKELLDQKTV